MFRYLSYSTIFAEHAVHHLWWCPSFCRAGTCLFLSGNLKRSVSYVWNGWRDDHSPTNIGVMVKILLVWQNLQKKKNNCAVILHPLKAKVFKSETTYFHYFLREFQKSKKFGQWTSGSGGKKTFKRSEQMKMSVKNLLDPLSGKVIKSETTSLHYFSARISNL